MYNSDDYDEYDSYQDYEDGEDYENYDNYETYEYMMDYEEGYDDGDDDGRIFYCYDPEDNPENVNLNEEISNTQESLKSKSNSEDSVKSNKQYQMYLDMHRIKHNNPVGNNISDCNQIKKSTLFSLIRKQNLVSIVYIIIGIAVVWILIKLFTN